MTLLEVIEIRPSMSKAWFGLGLIETELNRHEVAVKYFGKAIEFHNHIIEYYEALAQSFTVLSSHEQAESIYLKAIDLDNRHLANFAGLAYNQYQLGKLSASNLTLDKFDLNINNDNIAQRLVNLATWCLVFHDRCLVSIKDKKNFSTSLRTQINKF